MAPRRTFALCASVALLAAVLVGAGAPAAAVDPSIDGDGDGWINTVETLLGSDAGDPFKTPESFAIPTSCLDGADNDGDSATDDADPGCHPIPVISGSFPPAGFDVFESEMTLDGLVLDTPAGTCPVDFEGIGPTVIRRSNPAELADGRHEIDVEIVAMQLTGQASLHPGSPCNPGSGIAVVPATVVEDPTQASTGKVTSLGAGSDFPADSFFDVNFQVDTPLGLIPGGPPLRVENPLINTLPPYHTPNNPAGNPDCYEFGGVHEHCPKPPLDHFECYIGDFPALPPEEVALLVDQFAGSPATVTDPNLFCNPVRKNRLPIFDQGAHLEFFAVDSPQKSVVDGAAVVVRNQFGTQSFTLGELRELAVPTQKNAHPPPLALDHYNCYEVAGNNLNVPVALADQFGNSNTVVVEPSRLCAPAFKVHDGALTAVGDELWHLTCYTIQPTPFSPVTVTASNQFAQETLVVEAPWGLCVPSQKFFEGTRPQIPPVAVDDGPFTVATGGTVTVPDGAGDLLANDIDIEGDPLTAAKVSDPAHGTVGVNPDGSFTYVHDGSETTSDSFTYKANDGTADSDPALVSLTIVAGCAGRIATILGTAAGEVINGTAGDDVIVGLGGNDVINGGGGNDTICGGAGDDIIDGGAGNDSIDGGPGSDTVSYVSAPSGVTVDLGTGTASGGGGDDTLARIRHIVGSRFNDKLSGNAADNRIEGRAGKDRIKGKKGDDTLLGGAGDDLLLGRRGDDIIDGGVGTDTASFFVALNPMVVNLQTGSATGDGTDTLTGIENVSGSKHDDDITGNGAPNVLNGFKGSDTLRGRGGDDVLRGKPGDDDLFGEGGDDRLLGGGGDDEADGGAGDDFCRAETATTCERP